jgi:multiple sugar transport system substrate-binding protein
MEAMTAKAISRRTFLYMMGAAGGSILLAACGAPATVAPTATTEAGPPAEPTAAPGADATATAVAKDWEFDQSAPLQGLPDDPVLKMTEEEYAAKMEQDRASAEAEGKVVIEWLSAWGTILYDKAQPHYWMMKEFMEQNPDIYIHYTPSTAYTGAFDEVIMTRVASGDPPDVIYHYSSPIAYAIRGAALQIDDYMEADPVCNHDAFFEGGLGQCQWDGKTYGLACTMSPTLIYYSVEHLEKKGLPTDPDKLPKTLAEMKELSAQLIEWDGDVLKTGGFFPWAYDTFCRYGHMAANGGSFWDGAKYTINHPKNVELVTIWLEWLDDLYKGDIDKVNASGNWGGMYPGGAFALGQQAIGETGAWGPAHCPPHREYVLTKVPVGPSGTKPYNSCWPNMMFIPKGAKHPDEAYKFSAYASTNGAYWWWNQWADVVSWKEFPEDMPSRVHIARVGEEKARELARTLRSPLPEVILQWNSPVDNIATDEINRVIDEILHKVIDPQAGLDRAQATVQAKLEEVLATASD